MPAVQYRAFVATLNNYTDDDIKKLEDFAKDSCKYLVYGKEVGEEKKTPHLQIYAQLNRRTSAARINKLFKWHTETRKGTASQAAEYCKKDGDYKEFGEPPAQGKRNDIETLRTLLNSESPPDDDDLFNELPGVYLRYHKSIDRVRFNKLKKANRSWKPVDVVVIWGPTGTGKTRCAYEQDPNLYSCYDIKDLKWWCGYNGEKTILIDEFRGEASWEWLLRITDGYPFPLQIKGGTTWKCWDRVIITSNMEPSTWYGLHSWDETNPLKRRISRVVYKGSAEDAIEFD